MNPKVKRRLDRQRKLKRDREEKQKKFIREQRDKIEEYNDYLNGVFEDAEIYKTQL